MPLDERFLIRKSFEPPEMKTCTVSVVGKDGETHEDIYQSVSLFDAIRQFQRGHYMCWWWSRDLVVTVRVGEETWRVKVDRVGA
jgi:hypothetical protein